MIYGSKNRYESSVMQSINNQVIVYDNGEIELSISVSDENIWLKYEDIALLFGVKRPAIVKHIGNIYKTNELNEYATCSILEQLTKDNKINKKEL